MFDRSAELRDYLREHIPLARCIAVDVLEPGPDRVILEAPLEPNTNHRSTAFGGSVSALATLAGWALVHGRLRSEGREAQVVIQRGDVDYLRPVSSSFRAVCDGVEPAEWDRLVRAFDRVGQGRAYLDVRVEADGETAATFRGGYVAISLGSP